MGGEQLQNRGTAGLLVGGIVPLFFAKQAILFLSLFLAGGIVALFSHFKSDKPARTKKG